MFIIVVIGSSKWCIMTMSHQASHKCVFRRPKDMTDKSFFLLGAFLQSRFVMSLADIFITIEYLSGTDLRLTLLINKVEVRTPSFFVVP